MMNALANLSSAPLTSRAADMETTIAHPKVARRPAQWKRVVEKSPSTTPETLTISAQSPVTPWQEDARFSTMMVVLVLLLNMALFTTTTKTEPSADASVMIQQLTRASVLPTPRYNAQEKVNSFVTDEEDNERVAMRSFAEEHEKLLKQLERAPRAPYAE